MWYEMLPAIGILYGLSIAPMLINYAMGKYITRNGKPHIRNWDCSKIDTTAYLRDHHITGSEYIPQGLEAIPDQN